MNILSKIADSMQVVLTQTANIIAKETGFVKRLRKLDGSKFVQTLVFGWLSNLDSTIEELAQTAAALDVPITPQGLDKRFTPEAANLLEKVLENAVTTSVKTQIRIDLNTGKLMGPYLQSGKESDRSSILNTKSLPKGSLRITDLGYFSVDDFSEMNECGAYWLSRVKSQCNVCIDGKQWDLLELLERYCPDKLDIQVQLSAKRIPCRILCELYSKLVVMIIQHWILLTCWEYPNRSFFKAVKTIRRHAMNLAIAFASGSKEILHEALEIIARCLSSGCRINKRKTMLNTYQLLLEFS
jgi:hypothetical protein